MVKYTVLWKDKRRMVGGLVRNRPNWQGFNSKKKAQDFAQRIKKDANTTRRPKIVRQVKK